ncbi:MAG: tetratricopeptide repeat protein [Sphingobacteriales bacterium]|nr:MAG: tetratricopeptide repeat protein [Sphingobacteriales bacterium]
MMMKFNISLRKSMKLKLGLLGVMLAGNSVYAQTVADATKAIEKNLFTSATNMLQTIVQKEPNNAVAYYHLGNIYLYNEITDSAKYFYDKAIQANANEPLAYIGQGRLLLDKKQNAEARAQFNKALEMTKNKNAYVMNQIADAYVDAVSTADADFAIEMANKSKELDKKNLYYVITSGDAFRLKGDGSKGVAEYKSAIDKDPKFALAHLRVGELYAKLRTFPEAEKYYNNVIGIDPNYAPVYKDLGELYYQTGKNTKALESYKKYLDMVGRSVPERIRYASFLFVNKMYPDAITELNNVRTYAPENPLLLRILAYSQYETGAYEDGVKTIEKYFEVMQPKQDKIIGKDYEYYGRLMSKTGKADLAVQNLRKGLEQDTTATELYDVIAETYANDKKYKEAAKEIKTKIQKTQASPNNQDWFTLGRYQYMGSDFAGADSSFAKVNELFPNYAVGFLYRAKANTRLDPKSEKGLAKPYYEAFIEKAQADAAKYKKELVEANYYLASYNYFFSKDNAAAKTYANKVLELDPNYTQAKELLKQIK